MKIIENETCCSRKVNFIIVKGVNVWDSYSVGNDSCSNAFSFRMISPSFSFLIVETIKWEIMLTLLFKKMVAIKF